MISIVIPAYNEYVNLKEITKRICAEMHEVNEKFEIIFVDDGSKDGTYDLIKEINKDVKEVVGIKFSRNFGKEAAIFAGLSKCKGDACIVMDADMQHPVTLISDMISKWKKGYIIVEARKLKRQNESFIYRQFSKLFYRLLNRAAGMDLNNLSDFKLLDRKAIDVLNQLTEKQTFFRALSGWMGFKTCFIEFEVQDRFAGETKWSFKSLVKYAINNITSFSAIPLHLVTFIGVVFFIFSVILGINTLYNYFYNNAVSGFTTVILVVLILGTVLMMSLGIIGYYLGKIYDELKNRPRFIIQDMVGENNE